MFQLKDYNLSDINTSDEPLNKLYEIFKCTLNPDLTPREFNQYLFGCHPDSLEMSFIYQQDELAGFCTSAAYPWKVNGKKVIILRSAFGMRDEFKKGKFPLQGLFFKYMKYKLKHIGTPVYVAGFMANPLMYAMICKYTLTCYPRRNKEISQQVMNFKDALLQSMNLKRKELQAFVLKIHFQVRFKESDIKRITASEDKDVQYFLSINPQYRNQVGVLVLVPVTARNMAYTLIKYILRTIRKSVKFKKSNRNNSNWKKAVG